MNKTVCEDGYRKRLGRGLYGSGQSALELALAVPVLVVLLLGGADFARVFYARIAVTNAARAGAQYGSQTVVTAADSSGMVAAAKADGTNIAGLSATAKQCTCASSTTVAACAANYCTNDPYATFVEVDTQASFKTLVTYPGIPSSTALSGKAIMQVEQ